MASAKRAWAPAELLGAWAHGRPAMAVMLAGGAVWIRRPPEAPRCSLRGASRTASGMLQPEFGDVHYRPEDPETASPSGSEGPSPSDDSESSDEEGKDADAIMQWIHADIVLRCCVKALTDITRLRATFRAAMLKHLKEKDRGPGVPITLLVCKTSEQAARCERLRSFNDALDKERRTLCAELMMRAKEASPDCSGDLEVMWADMSVAFAKSRMEDRGDSKAWHIVHPEAEEEFWKSQNRVYVNLLSAMRQYAECC